MVMYGNLWRVLSFIRRAKVKDSMMVSLLGGLVGTIMMDISNTFLWRTRKNEMLYGHLAGSIIMRGTRTNRKENFILGQILHMITGSAIGIPVFQILKRTGTDNYLLKGGFTGLVSWGVLFNFGQRIDLFTSKAHRTKSHYSALWHNLLYGVSTAQAIVTLSDPSLFSKQQKSTLEQSVQPKQTTDQWNYSPIKQEGMDDSTVGLRH